MRELEGGSDEDEKDENESIQMLKFRPKKVSELKKQMKKFVSNQVYKKSMPIKNVLKRKKESLLIQEEVL